MTEPARHLRTEIVDAQYGIRRSGRLLIEDRLCSVQLIEGHGPDQVKLLNQPVGAIAPPDAERVAVGEVLEVEGVTGVFCVARCGPGPALVIEAVQRAGT